VAGDIVITALLKSQKDIPTHDQGDMAVDQRGIMTLLEDIEKSFPKFGQVGYSHNEGEPPCPSERITLPRSKPR